MVSVPFFLAINNLSAVIDAIDPYGYSQIIILPSHPCELSEHEVMGRTLSIHMGLSGVTSAVVSTRWKSLAKTDASSVFFLFN